MAVQQPDMPARKRLNHRGPLSIDVPSAWYFITLCAANHAPWVADIGRAVAPRPPETVGARVPRDRDGMSVSMKTPSSVMVHTAQNKYDIIMYWRIGMSETLHFYLNNQLGGVLYGVY